MYRARADAVSGTKVFADGKWLQCIGNKNVSVGEYVWTDGRCVYGHLQEPEQPKVIIASKGAGIPIILFDDQYCFYNYVSKLVPLKQPKNINDLHDINGVYYFDSDDSEQSKFRFMVNDYKTKIYMSAYASYNVYAVNVDKFRNEYKLIGQQKALQIQKNGEEIFQIDLSNLIAQHENTAKNSVPNGASTDSPIYSGYKLDGRFAVIENENNWSAILFVYAYARKAVVGEDVDTSYTITITDYIDLETHTRTVDRADHASGTAEFQSVTAYLVNQNGHTQLSSCQGTSLTLWGKEVPVWDILYTSLGIQQNINYRTVIIDNILEYSASFTPNATDVKIPLQDGYYFIINDYPDFPTNMFCYPLFMNISIYTKTDRLLLTETFHTRSGMTICKVGSKYLIGVRIHNQFGVKILDADTGYSISSTQEYDDDTEELNGNAKYKTYAIGTHYIREGLYLWNGKKLEKIADGDCLNERLRAMPKYKNWQNRIQEFK